MSIYTPSTPHHHMCMHGRRLAADVARRLVDVGAGPGRVLVTAVMARLRQCTEEALAAQIAASSSSSSSSGR